MNPILQALLGWYFVSFVWLPIFVICLTIYVSKKCPSLLLGCVQLLQSPSGVFGLLTLGAITAVTLIVPTVSGAAFVAFVAVVPAILAFCEHKETMAGINITPPSINITAPPINIAPPPAAPPPPPVLLPPDPNAAKPVIGSPDAPIS